jgi:hypothetical protein
VGKVIKSKKGIALLAALVVAIAAAVGAYAYFTSTGSGSGTGTVGTATGWSVAGGSVVGTLYPGASYSSADQGVVTGASVTNASASAHQNLNTIVATISGVTSAAGGGPACAVTDFQFNSPGASWSGSGTQTATINPNTDLAPGGSYPISDLNVAMVDNNANQDRCQGQTVTVTFNAS